MNRLLAYRLSLGLTIVLTLVAFVTLLGWLGRLIRGAEGASVLTLIPWVPLILLGLTAFNCFIRKRIIKGSA